MVLIVCVIFFLFFIGIILFHNDPLCFKRCNKLKKCNTYDLINNYKNVKKCTDDKVVISFSTTPENIGKIKPMLNSLLDQTAKVDQISLNLPDGYTYDIPNECKDICNIYEVGRDYGNGNKFVPTLLRENECGTKIILVEDCYMYGNDFVETILKLSDLHPDKSIFMGNSKKDISGILIKPEFVHDITHSKCDNSWLSDNVSCDKVKYIYEKNEKYL